MPDASAPRLPGDPVQLLRRTLLEGLQRGRWSAGERLPPERELCARFGVGRSALRRVLRELKDAGLIEQAVGRGTFASGEVGVRLPRHAAPGVSPAELMEARLMIEPLAIDLAVRNATVADFDELDECLRNAEAARTLEEFEHWDGLLHERIARATHNAFLVRVFQLMSIAREQGEWGELKKNSVTPERRRRYEREHRELVGALKRRNGARARALLERHLEGVRFNLLGR